MEKEIDALIEVLIPEGTLESAEVASILLAIRLALRDGYLGEMERLVWRLLDARRSQLNFTGARNGNGTHYAALHGGPEPDEP
jgi:hypothetical protein